MPPFPPRKRLFDEIIAGGPLDKNHLKMAKGMIIKQIDGVDINSKVDFAKFLNRKEGDFVSLSVE